MHSLHDLLMLRRHLRESVAGLFAVVTADAAHAPQHHKSLYGSLKECERCVGLFEQYGKSPESAELWLRFQEDFKRFRDLAAKAHALLLRWQAEADPSVLDAAACSLGADLGSAYKSCAGLLNHMISVLAFGWTADRGVGMQASLSCEVFDSAGAPRVCSWTS